MKAKILSLSCIFICIAVVIEFCILSVVNKKQIHRTSQIVLDQVDTILTDNEQSEQAILEELKSEYIDTAKAVAYILENDTDVHQNLTYLNKLAAMMGADEINLFDANGVIYGGTHSNYYGLSFDSGEQMAYFKPMLEDKSLSMCQDVTPNTAESKSMMYAITWNESKTYMVQIGVEPVRLLNAFEKNNISEVVSQMAVYEGMNIYVADISSGEILGTSDSKALDGTLYDIGLLNEGDDPQTIQHKSRHLNGFRNYCCFRQHEGYIIAVVHNTEANIKNFSVSLGIEVLWLLIAAGIASFSLLKLVNANENIKKQMSIVTSISDIYYSMHLIDLNSLSIEKLEGNELMDKVVAEGRNASDMLERIVRGTISDEYLEASLEFVNVSTLRDRLRNKSYISWDAIDKNVGWIRISFIKVNEDGNSIPTQVLLTTQIIDEEKKREEELSIKANRDELTGLFNRRAYEDDILNYPDIPVEPDFVYAAIDINGLKVVNDERGHAAGDEMIVGAARCLIMTLGNYGRVYRTGGDEFVAMFFADEAHLKAVAEDLEKTTLSWCGELVPELSLSVGYVTKQEFADETVVNMAKVADQRMYDAKTLYYAQRGIDRRGQAAAHTALCNLYTKILKINITNDSYSIVNMVESEKSTDKGFADKISEWFKGVCEAGLVHSEDQEEFLRKTDIEYLKNYFMSNMTSMTMLYRRKYEDGYKQVVMEMIPADDYSDDNQSLFLYVKTIDNL